MNQDIYQQHILEHAKHPKNKAQMESPSIEQIAKNVSCGDSYILYLCIEKGVIRDATFSGSGCAISTAAGSLLTQHLKGMTTEHAKKLTEKNVYELLGVTVSKGREKCALILFWALQEALERLRLV